MTGYEPPDDPSEAPTGYIDYGDYGQQEPEPGSPWYRKPAVLLGLGLLAAILVALAIYVIADLTKGGGGSTPTSTSPTTSTGVATTTEPVAPAPTTTLTYPPTTAEPTTTAPTSTSIDDGHHHHHHHADGGMP